MTDSNAFYSAIAQAYDHIFPLKAPQVKFASEQTEPGSVLDVGCATGALAVALAERGFRVTGIDLDPNLLQIAKGRAGALPVSFEVRDMTTIADAFAGAGFALCTCFGNTLSHLPPSDRASFFRQVKSVLGPGGVFAGQVVNYDRILAKGLDALPLIENDHIRFERYYDDFGPKGAFTFRTVLYLKGEDCAINNEISLYPIFRDQLFAELEDAGFKTSCYGTFARDPLDNTSFPLVFSART